MMMAPAAAATTTFSNHEKVFRNATGRCIIIIIINLNNVQRAFEGNN